MFTRTAATAESLTDYLTKELRDIDCKKILCLGSYEDVDSEWDKLGKYTVYVIADKVLQASFSLSHSVIPLVINYGMPATLQGLITRLSRSRQGFSAAHMAKYGMVETRIQFWIPLGASASTNSSNVPADHSMNKSQFEDLSIFLARVDAKTPDVLADLINLKSAKEFTCTSCYAVGEHRDNCNYDCPQAQE